MYELVEQQPVIIENEKLPISLFAKNGYHFSKTIRIENSHNNHIVIGVGCNADNGKFWGSIVLSTWLFVIFFVTKFYPLLIAANLPLIYIMYLFFWKPTSFIQLQIIKKK
jgi:hypothetical protein